MLIAYAMSKRVTGLGRMPGPALIMFYRSYRLNEENLAKLIMIINAL